MIKIILLTGFLGAGKTTLMEKLLDTYKDEKIGVIINDFGKVNVDAKLIERQGITMAELSNGSVFCACIKDKFVDGLIEMSRRDLTYLFIEASGLSDPSNMETIVSGIEKDTAGNLSLEGAIAVVDSTNFAEMKDVLPALERQVEYANGIILNKIDLVPAEELDSIEIEIRKINSRAKVYPATYCNTDIKEIVNNFCLESPAGADTTNTIESRAVTFVVKAKDLVKRDELERFLKAIASQTYRIKGFAKCLDGDFEVSCVGSMVGIIPWKDITETEIVVISAIGIKLMSTITKASADFAQGRIYANV